MKNKALLTALVVVGTIVIGVGISKMTGYWKTESSKIPMKLSEGEFAGSYSPGDIRGSYSFSDIETSFKLPAEITADAFGFTSDTPGDIKAKDLETEWEGLAGDVEVGTDSVRLFTALWTGLPHTPEETTVLPVRAVRLLEDTGKVSGDDLVILLERAVTRPGEMSSGEATPSTDQTGTEAADSHEAPDRMIRGLTTFGDMRGWGVSEETWKQAIGLPMGSRAMNIKDWAAAEGYSMSELKSTAQALVDAAE